jgi:hypothetical protein
MAEQDLSNRTWEDVAVLIPCYNEAITIAKVIDDFKRSLPGAPPSMCMTTTRAMARATSRASTAPWCAWSLARARATSSGR